jgi:hypothetical protein
MGTLQLLTQETPPMQPPTQDTKPANPHLLYLDFVKAHGDNPVQVMRWDPHSHGWHGTRLWLLPDGASVTNDGSYLSPLLHLPPADPIACLLAQRHYWREWLSQLERDCRSLALALKGYGDGFRWDQATYGPPHRTGAAALAFLQGKATTARANARRIEAELRAASPRGQQALTEAEAREAQAQSTI